MLPFPPVFCLRGKKVKRLKIYTPENWPLEEEIPIKNPSFSDSMLLFRGAKKVIPNPSPISPFLHLPNGSSDPWRLKNHDIARVEKTVVTIRFVSNLSIKKGVKTKCVKKMKYITVPHLFWDLLSLVSFVFGSSVSTYCIFQIRSQHEWIICHIGLFPVLRRCPLGMIFTTSPKTGPSQVTSCVL